MIDRHNGSTHKIDETPPMKATLSLLILAITTTGCSSTLEERWDQISLPELTLPSMPGIYRADIHQGNIVDQAMVDQLKPGMEKPQVRHILGSPLLIDTFHQDRWDYFYSLKQEGEIQEQRRLSLFFSDNRLTHLEGDIVPHK